MGDMRKTVAKPRIELEELYQGIPDESVNLTFQDLAQVNASEKKIPTIMVLQPISEFGSNGSQNPPKPISSNPPSPSPSPLAKLPSLDFNKGLQASSNHHHHRDFEHGNTGGTQHYGHDHDHFSHATGQQRSPRFRAVADHAHSHSGYTTGFDDMSAMNMGSQLPERERAPRRRRPGIPHSNICTICSNYIYIFRTRCLVCGRVYCRNCVDMGMGEMTEGRKCIECLGLRFSQRYIERAGNVGCCSWRYPSTVKMGELKWAEKGPRRSGDRGRSGYAPRSPISPASFASNEPSFVMSASYSPYSPHAHHLPL